MEQVTQRKYYEMLEVLPPAKMSTNGNTQGFLVGEPATHKEGIEAYHSYYNVNDEEYYRGDALTIKEYDALMEKGIDVFDSEYAEDCEQELILLENHPQEAIDAYINCIGIDYLENFEEAYQGQWVSDEDFITELVEDTMEIPEHLSCYIDWEKITHNYMMDYATDSGYYFRHI